MSGWKTDSEGTRLLRGSLRQVAEQADGVGSAMAYNFLPCDRDQGFLLPLEVRDWLPADHLAWFVLDVVDQLDLGPFLMAVERSQRREPGPPEMIWMPWAGKTSS
jgi:hypothetical protein